MYDSRQGWLFINPDLVKPRNKQVKIGEFLEILTEEFKKGLSKKPGWGKNEVLVEFHQAITRALHIEFEADRFPDEPDFSDKRTEPRPKR